MFSHFSAAGRPLTSENDAFESSCRVLSDASFPDVRRRIEAEKMDFDSEVSASHRRPQASRTRAFERARRDGQNESSFDGNGCLEVEIWPKQNWWHFSKNRRKWPKIVRSAF